VIVFVREKEERGSRNEGWEEMVAIQLIYPIITSISDKDKSPNIVYSIVLKYWISLAKKTKSKI
jgi:hypothetical protein